MKKLSLALTIIILVLTTAIIKNTTKKIEDKIFAYKESVRLLKSDLENIQLEYDYLSSAEKLLEYQSLYFEDQLVQKKIEDIKIYNISENVNNLEDYKIIKEK
ncbi:cell division protein FtsL [Candidatus Pelagibacter communis]|uniref:cell division protein FtsL n=1 Tax=Pelagibacter ubique TaxID=198252 RepID=UPI00065B3C64|nr:cell division protein FtsL [Candidatus Pelagibacter ubique]